MSSTSRQLVALNQSELAQFVSVVPSVLPYRLVSEPPPSVGDVFSASFFAMSQAAASPATAAPRLLRHHV